MTCTEQTTQHDKDLVVKHLEMIQGVINRLSFNSFLIKGWSITILVVTLLFIVRNIDYASMADSASSNLIYILIPMIIGFMLLDSYYLWQERLFRAVYNDVRMQPTTDFAMNVQKHFGKPNCQYRNVVLSRTILGFYAIELSSVLVIKFIVA